MSNRGPGGAARRLAEAAVAALRERAGELPTQTRLDAINRVRTRTVEQPADVLAQLEAAGVADDRAESIAAEAAADVGLLGEQAGGEAGSEGATGAPTSDLGALRERRRAAGDEGDPGTGADDSDDEGRDVQTGLGTQPGTIEFTTSEAAASVRELRDDVGSHAIGTVVEGGDADLLPEQQVTLREAIDVLGEQRVLDLADATVERDDDGDEGAFGGQQTLGQATTRTLGEFAEGDDPEEPPNPTERLVSATPGGTTEFFPSFEKSTARYTLAPGPEVPRDARCENCAHFIPGGGCHVVRGPIAGSAVCLRFYADAGVFFDDEFATGAEPRISVLLERGGLVDWSPAERRALARELRERVADEQGPGAVG